MKMSMTNITTEKLNGRIYTPEFIVNSILDLSGYYSSTILKKHVVDNSCGDGAFLVTIVKRYCKEFFRTNQNVHMLSYELSNYIHGIEIDENECYKCVQNLNKTTELFGISDVCWDIRCADTLSFVEFNGKMDFVLGNPPYVRVHNLGEAFSSIKKFSFAQSGMTDMFIVFFELGLKMLNTNGVLGYITPSSYYNSLAGRYMRKYLVDESLLDKVVDLKHYQAFNATTYTTITILKQNRRNNTTDYYQFDERNCFPYYVDTLAVEDYYIEGNYYFAQKNRLSELNRILTFYPKKEYFSVKNGFATLADDFFIGEFSFPAFVIPVVKASTGKWKQCIFPYLEGKLVSYQELTSLVDIKQYYETQKKALQSRSLENNDYWYGFGRTQGINDVYKCKYAINALIKDYRDLKLIKCDEGVGVYSGLYIITKVPEKELHKLLFTDEFVSYISLLGKYKSGGYYTFSSKDLKKYLEYRYARTIGEYDE